MKKEHMAGKHMGGKHGAGKSHGMGKKIGGMSANLGKGKMGKGGIEGPCK